MKKQILAFAAALLVAFTVQAQDEPQPSPLSTVSQKVGLTDVTITYYRPGLKGRDMYAKLTPEGEMWRTGANGGSKIKFSTDVTLGGQKVPAGEYLFFSIPNKDEWTITVYKDTSLGGYVSKYDEANELTRFMVKAEECSPKVETMTFGVNNISADGTTASVVFMWENTLLNIPLEVPKTW